MCLTCAWNGVCVSIAWNGVCAWNGVHILYLSLERNFCGRVALSTVDLSAASLSLLAILCQSYMVHGEDEGVSIDMDMSLPCVHVEQVVPCQIAIPHYHHHHHLPHHLLTLPGHLHLAPPPVAVAVAGGAIRTRS